MLFISIIIYLLFTMILYPRIFEKVTISKLLIVIFLCIFSINILVAEILSLLHLLNHPWIYLGIQSLICIILTLVIQHYFPIAKEKLISNYRFSDFRFSKLEVFLLVIISAIFAGFFIVGVTTPISNIDSLATHLPRIYYWLQHGSFEYWTTTNLSQLTYPINTLIQGVWLFLLSHSENLFFLIQWFSLIIIAISVFEISILLGFSNTQALLCALVGLSFPVVLLQTFSIQGDLTVTALVLICIIFLLNFIQTKTEKYLWVACCSIIIAIGSKQTAMFFLPILGLIILYVLIKTKSILRFFRLSWILVIMLGVFSSYQYFQNLINTGSFFGMDSLTIEKYSSLSQVTQKALYVIPRFTYQFIGTDGLPRSIQPAMIGVKEEIFKRIFTPLGLDLEKEIFIQPGFDEGESFHYDKIPLLSEDTAWFGPLAFLLIPLAVIITFFSKNKLRRNYAIFCFLNSIVYLLLVFIQRPGWDPYQGRYFILSLIPFIPLVSILLPKNKPLRGILIGIIISFSLLVITTTFFFNNSKPIITAKTQNDIINNVISPLPENNRFQVFLKKTLLKITYPSEFSNPIVNIYEATYYDRLFYSDTPASEDMKFINQNIPDGESLSTMIYRSPLEFALFGKNRSRSVNPVTDINNIQPGYLLVNNTVIIPTSSEMTLIAKNNSYSIYYFSTK